jgi:lipopolysaccharide transport system permease protein
MMSELKPKEDWEVRIQPLSEHSLRDDVKSLMSYRQLLYTLAMREISVRYKQTVVGVAWVAAQPIVTSLIFTFIFSHLAKIESGSIPYPIFVFSGLLLWQYISRIISEGTASLVAQSHMMTKVFFPRMLIPLIGIAAATIDLCIAALVLLCIMMYLGVGLSTNAIFFPIIVLVTALIGYSLALALSPINALYRDVGFIIPFALQMLMYLSPVLYPVSLVPANYRWLYELNPVATLLEAARWSLFGEPAPSLPSVAVLLIFVVISFSFGRRVFRALEPTIVDRV